MKTYILLLRGVMPTGKNRVPMAELRVALSDAGLVDVRTYIQSGNVIAKSDLDPTGISQLAHDTIKQIIGADITVITRTPEQIKGILAGNPFPNTDLSRLYYSLLSSPPAPELLQKFLELDFSPDELRVADDTIYTRYATKLSDSKFTNNFFEKKLKCVSTTRNTNTMTRLVELCKQKD
ncbi:MAG: DUF1697 domain-containing protein [Desulfuromonadaceae bacterium]|nr:DUF1697 domain-containing protein [Desulfuromonadaceae bacterium]